MSSFLQYQYTGEYFPRRASTAGGLESDPSIPELDETGDQLLRHARVYELKTLAQGKIYRINSAVRVRQHVVGRQDDPEACCCVLGDAEPCPAS